VFDGKQTHATVSPLITGSKFVLLSIYVPLRKLSRKKRKRN